MEIGFLDNIFKSLVKEKKEVQFELTVRGANACKVLMLNEYVNLFTIIGLGSTVPQSRQIPSYTPQQASALLPLKYELGDIMRQETLLTVVSGRWYQRKGSNVELRTFKMLPSIRVADYDSNFRYLRDVIEYKKNDSFKVFCMYYNDGNKAALNQDIDWNVKRDEVTEAPEIIYGGRRNAQVRGAVRQAEEPGEHVLRADTPHF